MSVGPLGILGSAAGSPLPQAKGADVEATQQKTAEQTRRTNALRTAEAAEGLGEMDQDQKAEDRDADGRRPWERHSAPQPAAVQPPADENPAPTIPDPTGQRGTQLDISG